MKQQNIKLLSANLVNLNPNAASTKKVEATKILKIVRRKSQSPENEKYEVGDEPKISPPSKGMIIKKSVSPPKGQELMSFKQNFKLINYSKKI